MSDDDQDERHRAEEILAAAGLPPMRADVDPGQPVPGEAAMSVRLAQAHHYLAAAPNGMPWAELSTGERFALQLQASEWVRAAVLAGLIPASAGQE